MKVRIAPRSITTFGAESLESLPNFPDVNQIQIPNLAYLLFSALVASKLAKETFIATG